MPDNTFQVKIVGLDRMLAAFKRAPEIVEPTLQQAIENSGLKLHEHAVDRNITPWVTGVLAGSFLVEFDRLATRIWPWVEYARAVQFGMPASPGRFVPAIGKRLVDSSRAGFGTWPGFKGRHYMEKIRAASKEDINLIFKNALIRITEKLAKE